MNRDGKENEKNQFSFTEDSGTSASAEFIAKGKINFRSSSFMEAKLLECLEAGRVNIIIDMCMVTFLSSVGIRAVLSAYRKAKALGGSLRIKNPSENVRNVLGMVALDEMML